MEVDVNVSNIFASSKKVSSKNYHFKLYCQLKTGDQNFLLSKGITRKERLKKDEEDKHNNEILKNVPRLERQIEDLKKEVLEQKYELELNEDERVILQ